MPRKKTANKSNSVNYGKVYNEGEMVLYRSRPSSLAEPMIVRKIDTLSRNIELQYINGNSKM